MPFVSACCEGEHCRVCGSPAEHKVEEAMMPDEPIPHRHPLTAYICHKHFREIMGPYADDPLYRNRRSEGTERRWPDGVVRLGSLKPKA